MYAHGIRPNTPSRVSSIPRFPTVNPNYARQIQSQTPNNQNNTTSFSAPTQNRNQNQNQSSLQMQTNNNNNYESLLNQFNAKLVELEKSHQVQTQQANQKIENLNSQISKLELGVNNISKALTNIVDELEKTEEDLVTTNNNSKTRVIVEEDTQSDVNIPNQYIVTPDDLSDTD